MGSASGDLCLAVEDIGGCDECEYGDRLCDGTDKCLGCGVGFHLAGVDESTAGCEESSEEEGRSEN